MNAEELIIGLFTNCGKFVGYKANIAGVKVVFVPAAYTSQTSDADIFTRLRVSRTVMEKFLSVGIVV